MDQLHRAFLQSSPRIRHDLWDVVLLKFLMEFTFLFIQLSREVLLILSPLLCGNGKIMWLEGKTGGFCQEYLSSLL